MKTLTTPDPPKSQDLQEQLARYQLVERIAVGGMAEVFRAKAYGSHGFEKVLAIKRILPDLAQDPEFENRFIDEAKLAVGLTHANIVQIFDFGRFGGSLFIAMEYVDGPDLAALCRAYSQRERNVPVGSGLHIAMELLKGLDFAHRKGVVHRDVSPSNILLSRAGDVKIADFGIAQAAADPGAPARSRRIMGKWRYMSPEQARGDKLDAKSDLFSAAVVIFELLTGRKLFPGDDAETIVRNVCGMDLPRPSSLRPDLPVQVDDVLMRALERDPAKRPAAASDMLRALIEVSYSRTLVATALDVAEVIAEAFPQAPTPPPDEAKLSARLIDDIIKSELMRGAGAAGGPDDEQRITHVTERIGLPDELRGEESPALALGLPPGVDPYAQTATGVTFVRSAPGPDGITRWEIRRAEPEDPTTVGPPLMMSDELTPATATAVPHPLPEGGRADTVPSPAPAMPTLEAGTGIRPRSSRAPLVIAIAAVAAASALAAWRLAPRRAAAPIAAGGMAGGAHDAPPAATMATLRIESTPPDAEIVVDGVPRIERTPAVITISPSDAAHPHQLELRAKWHRPYRDDSVAVAAGQIVVYRPVLEALTTRLEVKTTPPGADVLLDGLPLGPTPLARADIPVDGAEHELVVKKKGFADLRVPVTFKDADTVQIERALDALAQPARTGRVKLFVDPWAEVWFEGKKLGDAPAVFELPVGKQKITLVHPQLGKKTIVVDVPLKGEPLVNEHMP